ncbi:MULTISPECIES: T9SS type A sorting domain-containing protein [Aequorivita]|uniref:T9SS type A sorting domain-containing protein n=2 Tax=Aequorivita TaxID=153265 RepID=A0AB35YQZ4_9FLAO|nr:T9SS type A sorting domain-containing protein [Aequorivita sp. Ant34-E75]WGF93761.1 T9SS type A sorting domain-containing protein [Aequorivita sp. Ant34-E75]
MKTFITIFILALSTNAFAQITQIPDPVFEQALIDLGIDSDGIVNGQVLTSDVETVISLNLNHKGIDDITGIEDFAALEILDVTGNYLLVLDVSNNLQLKELYCSSDSAGFNMPVSSLDLTNNTNLEILYGENLIFLESLDAKNGNNGILNITLPCEFEGEPCQLTELDCVKVDDELAANNNEPPYNGWYLAANFVYSEDCILGVSENNSSTYSIHPNPAKNELFITAQNTAGNLKVKIFNIEGKLLSTQTLEVANKTSIDVSSLTSGIYFLNIEDENGITIIKKFVKE